MNAIPLPARNGKLGSQDIALSPAIAERVRGDSEEGEEDGPLCCF